MVSRLPAALSDSQGRDETRTSVFLCCCYFLTEQLNSLRGTETKGRGFNVQTRGTLIAGTLTSVHRSGTYKQAGCRLHKWKAARCPSLLTALTSVMKCIVLPARGGELLEPDGFYLSCLSAVGESGGNAAPLKPAVLISGPGRGLFMLGCCSSTPSSPHSLTPTPPSCRALSEKTRWLTEEPHAEPVQSHSLTPCAQGCAEMPSSATIEISFSILSQSINIIQFWLWLHLLIQ